MFINNPNSDSILLEKLAEPLFKATLSGGLSNIFAACLAYLLFQGTSYKENATWLCVGVIVFSIIRIIISRHYLKKHSYKIRTYLQLHILLTLIIGIVWGFLEYMPTHQNDEALRSYIFIIGFGLIAGSTATLSVFKEAYLAYILPQSIAIFSSLMIIDTEISYYIGYGFIIFTIFMISASFNLNKIRKKEINLTLYNKELINDLNNEIGIREQVQLELENNKQDLENKVNERTKELRKTNLHLENVIDKKEQAEQDLQYIAYHDELTGLPNKNLLVDRINQSIKTSSRDNQKMAILFLDLDRFKNINDSLGHPVGDELLREVAARLYKTLRSHDTVSRNGGDEFVIVLERLKNTNEAINVAKKIINCLTDTLEIQSHKIHIGASIGISIYPGDGDTPLTLLRNADTAMYRAKQNGGNQLQFYDKSMSNQLRDRLELENELHTALDNNEFYMAYQPQINSTTSVTTGFESLIRWNNKKYGQISPDRFVPLLEETGLIYAVGEWVVKEVLKFIKTHQIDDIRFSINLSALQCNDFEFVDFVGEEIKKSGIDPSLIEFEITESLLINDFDKTKLFLNKLHSIGCFIALDDFGTGYTSMNYLAQLPVDVIKIDKTLVRDIDINNNLQSIVKAIVIMSESLGMQNIFEGIETQSELAIIKKMGGNIIQGYLYSKPLSGDEVDQWLLSYQHVKHA